MSKTKEQIINGLKTLSAKETEIFSGVVKSVDEEAGTMEVMPDPDDEDFAFTVMLRASVEDLKGIVLVPKEGTEVTFVTIDGGGQFTIVNASELTKVLIDVPEMKLKCDSVIVNTGNDEMVRLQALEKNLEELQKYCEALKTATASGLFSVGIGSSASGTNGKNAFDGAMAGKKISFVKMGNPKFKH